MDLQGHGHALFVPIPGLFRVSRCKLPSVHWGGDFSGIIWVPGILWMCIENLVSGQKSSALCR